MTDATEFWQQKFDARDRHGQSAPAGSPSELAPTDFVKDPEASLFWRMNFQQEDEVSWGNFSQALQAHFDMQLGETEMVRLEAACRVGRLIRVPSSPDPFSAGGVVSKSNFQTFLQLFGPFSTCLDNCLLADTVAPVTRDERIAHLKKNRPRSSRSPHGSPDRCETLTSLHAAVDAAKRDAEAAWDRVRVLEAGSHEGLQQLQDELERVKLERDDSHQNCNALESKLKDKDETVAELQEMVYSLESEVAKLKNALKRAKADADKSIDRSEFQQELEAEAMRWKELLDAQEAEMQRTREKAARGNSDLQQQLERLKDEIAAANQRADEERLRADRAERALERTTADAERARNAAAEADLAQQEREAELKRRQAERELQLREDEKRRLEEERLADEARKKAEEARRRQAAEEEAARRAAEEAARRAAEEAARQQNDQDSQEAKAKKRREKMDQWVLKAERKLKVFFEQVAQGPHVGLKKVESQRRSLVETLGLRGATPQERAGEISFGRMARIFYLAEPKANHNLELDFEGFKQFAFDFNAICTKFKEKKSDPATQRAAGYMGNADNDPIARAFKMYDEDDSNLVMMAEIYAEPFHFCQAAECNESDMRKVEGVRERSRHDDTGVLDYQAFHNLVAHMTGASPIRGSASNSASSSINVSLKASPPKKPVSKASVTTTTTTTTTTSSSSSKGPAVTKKTSTSTYTNREKMDEQSMLDRFSGSPASPRKTPATEASLNRDRIASPRSSKGAIRDRADQADSSMLDRFK